MRTRCPRDAWAAARAAQTTDGPPWAGSRESMMCRRRRDMGGPVGQAIRTRGMEIPTNLVGMSEPDPAHPIRFRLVQPAQPKYRLPVFRELAARPGIDLEVIYAEEPGLPNAEADGYRARFVPQRRFV